MKLFNPRFKEAALMLNVQYLFLPLMILAGGDVFTKMLWRVSSPSLDTNDDLRSLALSKIAKKKQRENVNNTSMQI